MKRRDALTVALVWAGLIVLCLVVWGMCIGAVGEFIGS